MCNPNGDPDDEKNRPRMDYKRERNLALMLDLRDIAEIIYKISGYEIFVAKCRRQDR